MTGTSNPDEIADLAEAFTERCVKGIVRAFVEEVRDRNPVFTGHSKANWIVSTGAPFPTVLGYRSLNPGAVNDAVPMASLASFERAWKLDKGNPHVTNNVPYVPRINASHKVAKGYVIISVLTAVAVGLAAGVSATATGTP